MTKSKQQGRLYIVGVGPGDPELMTYKAVRVLERAPVWLAPKAREKGNSSALRIASGLIDIRGKEILEVRFPMKKVRLGYEQEDPEVLEGWQQAADMVLSRIDIGKNVAFPTLGDPSLYSTAFYLLSTLQKQRALFEVTIIPGVTAITACSAQINSPVGLGDDIISIVPAAFDDERLRHVISTLDAAVLMKVNRNLAKVIEILDELGLTDKAVLVERCGLEDQRVYTDIRKALGRKLHYFSTLFIRKRGWRM